MTSDEFILYYPPGEQPCFAKLLSDSVDGDGVPLHRYRMFRGKNRLGFTQALLRDPCYVQIDAWTKANGLPPLEFVPTAWLEQGLVRFETGVKIEIENDSPEQAYIRWTHIKNIKDDRIRIQNKVADRVHRMYSTAQSRFAESARQDIYKNFLAKGVSPLKVTGAASQEINRQELSNVNRGVLIALAHCEANAVKLGKTIADFRDILFEREKMLLERAIQISSNPKNWDSITEMVDTPPQIANFFNDTAAAPWEQLSVAQQELFRSALTHAQADEV